MSSLYLKGWDKMGTFFIGVDLGQAADYTAIVIVERINKEYHLRHIERPPLGTPYPAIVNRLKELAGSPQLAGMSKTVVIDVTGVGAPVWDMMRQARIPATLKGILITGGNTVTRDGAIYHIPKRDIVTCLQLAFQNGELRIAQGLPLSDILVQELINFKVKINLHGHDQYEAWRESIHDDVVLAGGMAVWMASQSNWGIENLRYLNS